MYCVRPCHYREDHNEIDLWGEGFVWVYRKGAV
jgi:hypothetical protein